MPILPAEPDVFPQTLFSEELDLPESERVWWVMHTRPRQEKSLARHLFRDNIPFYLPLATCRRRMASRNTITSYVPLFPGYLFVFGDRHERLRALSTCRVIRTLDVISQAELWRDLRQVHRLISSGMPITPEGALTPGTTVEIRGGPLDGLEGKILKTSSGRRFVVQVDFIQRGASVLLDECFLVKSHWKSNEDVRVALPA